MVSGESKRFVLFACELTFSDVLPGVEFSQKGVAVDESARRIADGAGRVVSQVEEQECFAQR